MLNRLAPVSNPKNEKVKRSKTLVCPFLVALFHFETSLIKVFPFSETILDSGKFLPSWSEAKKLAGSDKKIILRINLVPSVPSFYTDTKFRLKNRVTTVHLLHCKTNFFIHIYAFEGETYCKFKNTQLGKPPLI